MTRREALAVLMALPAVKDIAIADVQPTDVIVVECDMQVSEAGIANIKAQLATIWPDRKIIVFDQGYHLRIARNTVVA
jgi:hypothetical protein